MNSYISPFNFTRFLKIPIYERLEGLKIYLEIIDAKWLKSNLKIFDPILNLVSPRRLNTYLFFNSLNAYRYSTAVCSCLPFFHNLIKTRNESIIKKVTVGLVKLQICNFILVSSEMNLYCWFPRDSTEYELLLDQYLES